MKYCCNVIDVSDEESFNKGALSLFMVFKPTWDKDNISIEHLNGGTTNRIVLGWCKDPRDKILLRIYGLGSEILIDRKQEIDNM